MGYYTRFRHILRLKGTLSLETGLGKPVAMLLQRFSEFSCFTTNLYLSWYPKGTWDKVLYSSVIPVTIDRFHSLVRNPSLHNSLLMMSNMTLYPAHSDAQVASAENAYLHSEQKRIHTLYLIGSCYIC